MTDTEKLREEIKGYVVSAFPNACKDCGADLTGEVLFEQAVAYIFQALKEPVIIEGRVYHRKLVPDEWDLPDYPDTRFFYIVSAHDAYRLAQKDMSKAINSQIKELE